MSDSDTRIASLEARLAQQSLQITSLEARLFQFDELSAEVSRLRSEMSALSDKVAAIPVSQALRLSEAVDRLQCDLAELKTAKPLGSVSGGVRFDSLISPEFPSLFNELAGCSFELLYRGSRDGFGAKDFHTRCDGRSGTVTLIKTPQGFVFGGFTPCRWESGPPLGQFIGDETLKSFLFTIKNPHNTNPRKFPLKADRCAKAVFVDLGCGPTFGGGSEIAVGSNCDSKAVSSTRGFGNAYVNDTQLDGKTFFTGEPSFVVKEIEVFAVIE
jgi:uncharacterized coiled-coil protein SlyX